MSTHAILSPSSAARWLACSPSARFEEQYPDVESIYAREGTLAHELAAVILALKSKQAVNPDKANEALKELEDQVHDFYEDLGKPSEWEIMRQHAEEYADFVLSQTDKRGALYIERRYDLTDYVPLGFGTADATYESTTLYVTDYKYGAGVKVSAEENKQMMLYALGALKALGSAPRVVMAIFQPRVNHVSTWEINTDELLNWAENTLKPRAKQAMMGVGDFVAGEHCKFCKAQTVCKAFYDKFAGIKSLRDQREMSDEELAEVLTYGSSVATWVKKVEEETILRLSKGEKIEGFKLVAGRGRRSFKNEDNVVDILLGEGFESFDIFDPKLRSFTELEKQLGKSKFKDLLGDEIIQIEGKPSLAPADDKRQAIGMSAADEYK
ncbi:MAG: DUF2800 domain-containing protein [Bergeyella sp.]|nr:DUF2800 domain-containing protein [Bergeyella sp.]